MKKKELAELAGVSTYTINKLNKNENVTVEVLGKICKVLDCSLDDIMEFEDRWWKASDWVGEKNEKEEDVNLESVLCDCRVALKRVGTTEKNRDTIISLVFLKFAGDKFKKHSEKIKS